MNTQDVVSGEVNTRVVSGVLLTILVALAVVFYFHEKRVEERTGNLMQLNGTLLATPQSIHDFALIDNEGNPFTLSDLKGHWSFVFFGFTGCADICTKTLSELDLVARKIKGWKLSSPQFVMVSIDPTRDTPNKLHEYVKSFNEDFIGATGTKNDINSLAQDLSVMYLKIKNEDGDVTAEEYTVDRKGTVMLVNPDGQLRAVFSMPHNADVIARDFITITKSKQVADNFGLVHRSYD